ncbi:MAG: hypothetical protein JWL83_1852, partial [Actinomycetia bacterium]|nr:hypothetical protein [Actinomycetes bacterium]
MLQINTRTMPATAVAAIFTMVKLRGGATNPLER